MLNSVLLLYALKCLIHCSVFYCWQCNGKGNILTGFLLILAQEIHHYKEYAFCECVFRANNPPVWSARVKGYSRKFQDLSALKLSRKCQGLICEIGSSVSPFPHSYPLLRQTTSPDKLLLSVSTAVGRTWHKSSIHTQKCAKVSQSSLRQTSQQSETLTELLWVSSRRVSSHRRPDSGSRSAWKACLKVCLPNRSGGCRSCEWVHEWGHKWI